MLGIVAHRHLDAEIDRQRIDEAIDRPGALAFDALDLAIVGDLGRDDALALVLGIGIGVVIDELEARARLVDVALEEALVDALRGQLLALFVGDALDVLAELDLQVARQVEPVILPA